MLTRVTNIGQNNNTINRLTLSQNKFLELQNQLMSGESVSKPSDENFEFEPSIERHCYISSKYIISKR